MWRDGADLAGLARRAVSDHLAGREAVAGGGEIPSAGGVFVTLSMGGSLRGCVGFLAPRGGLLRDVAEAAVAAATRDPRFPPVRADQLDEISFEVTVLSEPAAIDSDPEGYEERIRIGRDGILVRRGAASGLLLPQVAEERGWSPRQFLGAACEKAGLPRDSWMDGSVRVMLFGGTVYGEGRGA